MSVALVAEVRLATRSLLRTPWFLLVAALTLALGVGSVSAIYTVVRGTLLQPLPYPEAEQVVRIDRVRPPHDGPVTRPVFTAWREGSGSAFTAFAAYTPTQLTLSGSGEAERVPGYQVTPEFWDVLGSRRSWAAGSARPRKRPASRSPSCHMLCGCGGSVAIPPWSGVRCSSTDRRCGWRALHRRR